MDWSRTWCESGAAGRVCSSLGRGGVRGVALFICQGVPLLCVCVWVAGGGGQVVTVAPGSALPLQTGSVCSTSTLPQGPCSLVGGGVSALRGTPALAAAWDQPSGGVQAQQAVRLFPAWSLALLSALGLSPRCRRLHAGQGGFQGAGAGALPTAGPALPALLPPPTPPTPGLQEVAVQDVRGHGHGHSLPCPAPQPLPCCPPHSFEPDA